MLERLVRHRRHRRWRASIRWLLTGERYERLPPYEGLYERPPQDREKIGVCWSGGGLPAAAFGLGALQVLQAESHRVLQRAAFLSAVSGGAFAPVAYSMSARTWRRPGDDDSDPALVHDDALPLSPGSPEEAHFRDELGQLVPVGSGRTHVAVRVATGLVVNLWLVTLPVFFGGLLVGWLASRLYGLDADAARCTGGCDVAVHVPGFVVVPLAASAGGAILLALLGAFYEPARAVERVAIETWETRLFLFSLTGTVLLVLAPWFATQAIDFRGISVGDVAVGSAGAVVSSGGALFLAALDQVRIHVRQARQVVEEATRALGRRGPRVRRAVRSVVVDLACLLLFFAAAVLGVLLAVLALGGSAAIAGRATPLHLFDHLPRFGVLLGATAGLLAALWLSVDLTTLSLHQVYRRRLERALAVKRVGGIGGEAVAVARDPDRIVPLSQAGVEPEPGGAFPAQTLVICASVRLGGARRGTACSFTFSATAIGGPSIGAAPTVAYEEDLDQRRRAGLTLPAVAAMSSAAVAPAIARQASRPLLFLLGLATVRLGAWVPNPVDVNDRQGRNRRGWRPGPRYLLKEAFGRLRPDDRFLYVNDGGLYENLGLVELLRRGCRTVYCFDAGASLGALIDAIALARTELGVEIVMEPEADGLEDDRPPGEPVRCCARGRIRYPADHDGERVEGTLFYARAIVPSDAPWELRMRQAYDPPFPRHGPFDPSFDEGAFEGYRQLGALAAERARMLAALHT